MGAMLLSHLSESNARENGITLHGEAVVDGAHTLFLILEAASKAPVDAFMQPFAMAGEVEIMPASACEVVVARGGCDVAPNGP
ncbi:MAG: hypothetical protein QOF51_4057 [Chloroflexota bacterium]|nr:hypothetical protein [Chloroflexota bacterium]